MRACLAILFVTVPLLGACGNSSEPEPTRSDYSCRVCGEYDSIIDQRNESAAAAGCQVRTAEANGGVTCTVDNIQYDELLISYEGCESEPPCPEGSGETNGEGGNSGFGWDYECHICGDESEVDSAHDGGSEGARCDDSGILRGVGETCDSGKLATVVGFSGCEGVPFCVTE